MRSRADLVVTRMTELQLWSRLIADTYELDQPMLTQGDVARRKRLPSEMRDIARELRVRGTQLTMQFDEPRF